MKAVFTVALHLLCDLHMKDNIDRKMKDCNIDPTMCVEIRHKIFGRKVGPLKIAGLVDCRSEEEFDEKVKSCLDEWESLNNDFSIS